MRKGMVVFFSFLFLFLTSCGGINTQATVSLTEKEAVYYQKGYKKGYEKGFEEGRRDVWKKVKENLKLWEKDVLAFEAGKFALEKGYLTQPVMYRSKTGAEVKGGVPILSKVEEILKLSIPQLPQIPTSKVVETKGEEVEVSYPSFYPAWAKVPYIKGYQKGYKEGYEKGKMEGEKEVKDFERSPVFVQTFLSLEREKYYLPPYLITYPRLYKVFEGSKVRIVVIPSRIEPLRKDLLSLKVPLPEEKTKMSYDGIVLPATSTPYYFSGKKPLEPIEVKVKCSLELQKWEIPFVKKGNYCIAYFPDREVKEQFCKDTKLCR